MPTPSLLVEHLKKVDYSERGRKFDANHKLLYYDKVLNCIKKNYLL